METRELSEACVAEVLSFTSPGDACRMSTVSSLFMSAAESDIVWGRFLPPDFDSIISKSSNPLLLDRFRQRSKKHLFLYISRHPLFIDNGKTSFWVDKWSGKKCYMLSARSLVIVWVGTPRYWRWKSEPDCRFKEVAELVRVCWLEIRGKVSTSMLSTGTLYGAHFVFKSTPRAFGFVNQPVDVTVGLLGTEASKRSIYLDAERMQGPGQTMGLEAPEFAIDGDSLNYPRERGDGWLEIEMGEYFHGGGEDGEQLEMCVLGMRNGNWKGGLIVQGIEIRPKHVNKQV